MHWYVDVLKKYAVFTGRATRKEYWMFTLWNLIIMFFIGAVAGVLVASGAPKVTEDILSTIYFLAVLLPSLGVFVRRLHDTGRSGWWFFIAIIPLIGAIILIVFLVQDSHPDNQYGPNPKGMTTPTPVNVAPPIVEKAPEVAPIKEEVVINDIPEVTQETSPEEKMN
jgi:uncharacterized membrane protein YhaH (DUF805 family)